MDIGGSRLSSWGIFIGLIVGSIIGYIFNLIGQEHFFTTWVVSNIFQPMGTIFLRSLFMIVVPLVFSSLTLGVANLGSAQTLKRMGLTILFFYVSTTICAILIGQVIINTVQPGTGLDQEVISSAMTRMETRIEEQGLKEKDSSWVTKSLWPGIIKSTIPKNIVKQFGETNMLAVIFVSILFGISLIYIKDERAGPVLRDSLAGISKITVMIVGWIMKTAPYAVAALMASAVFDFGLDIMGSVIMYIGCVFLGYFVHFIFVYGSIIKYVIKISPKEFFKRASLIFLTAFSTSSSSATMPVTMRTLKEKFGIPSRIVNFTVPIGVTFNMDGTALFEVIAAIFVAQVFGVPIDLTGQITLIALVLITSIGVAGIPGGSIPILMAAMGALNIPPEGIALILGVDRLLDMGRTTLNVTGDTVAALFASKQSGVDVKETLKNIPS